MPLELSGIIPPVVTPFGADEQVDETAVRGEIRHQLDAGVHGVCVTGSTGEGAAVSADDAVRVATAAVTEAAGSVPVIAGIIRDSTREVVRYGQALRETGVDALQVTPVHYLFQPDADTTVDYYRTVAAETGLPIVIYNVIPWATIPAATVARILDEVPGVIAVKQSGGDIHALADLLHLAPAGGAVLTAIDDLLYPSYALGARGAISATLTVVPELCVRQWDAYQRGDNATALEIHHKLLPVWRAIDGPNMPARIKAGLAEQGRDGGRARSPMNAVTDAERAAVRAALVNAGVVSP